ncbi:hypothetical protein Tco_0523426 [Tanacetum coccineum]
MSNVKADVYQELGKSYDPPDNPNDQQNNSKTPINFDSDDEDEEPTPQPKTKPPKPVKEMSLPKPYKPKIPNPQRLRKEKMEARYEKFLEMIRAVRTQPFLSDESSAILQNKVPPKLGDPRSFLIPCNFNKTFSCNALADLKYFDALLDEGSKILYSIEGTILEEEIFSEFDKFIPMVSNEN